MMSEPCRGWVIWIRFDLVRLLDQQGFVIHARDYGETSQIVDLLTRNHGRVAVVHKGARQHRKGSSGRLQAFTKYGLGWTGKSQLKTLIAPESVHQYGLLGQNMAAGFYINELIWYLVHHEDECVGIFEAYETCLEQISGTLESLEPALRSFEKALLDNLGYSPQWEFDAVSGEPIEPDQTYYFRFGEGFYMEKGELDDLAVQGSEIFAIARGDYSDKRTLSIAKKLFRRALAVLLDGRELQSRKMVTG